MIVLFVIMILISILVIYTAYDNRRIKIRKQNVVIENGSNNIKILVIADLHSKRLRINDYKKINSLDYDVIAFCGDIFVDEDKEYIAIKEFLKNEKNKKNIVYVDGNNGTKAYQRIDNNLTDFGKYLESLGVTVIKDITEINGVLFTNYNAVTSKLLDKDMHGKYGIFDSLNTKMKECNKLNIGITHYPLTKEAIDILNKSSEYYTPNLIIAGHYHGGQIRVPFFGAILVPRYLKSGFNFFPNQRLVSGLYEKGKVKQYISRGVGATTHIKLLSFRLFNTPEVDIINVKY